MIFFRINLILGIMLVSIPLVWGAPQDNDIENRFIYSDYSRKISMDFKSASLTDILKIFSKETGKNFMSAQDVSGKTITVFLDNIPVEEALEKILETNNLTYEMLPNSDIFIIKEKPPAKLITKVYALKYATVSGSKLKTAASGITAALSNVISKNGKVQEDVRSNSYIITDLPEQFALIEDTLAKLDIPVLQVLIEVEMLDVSKNSADQIGISYGNGGPFVKIAGSSRSSTFPFDEQMIQNKTGAGKPTWTGSSTGYDFTGMSAALSFLRSQGDSHSLARPRLLTLNNETAQIEIQTDEAIGLNSVSTSTTSSSSSTVATAERAKTGVSLEVTPQANAETGEILMIVTPKVSDASGTSTFGTTTFKNPEERTSKSILKVKNGETIILGGLLRTSESNSVSKLPILGDIPLIGAAFRNTEKSSKERELIIFITPYILDEKFKKRMDSESTTRLNREINESPTSGNR